MDFILLQFANLLSLMDPVVHTRYVQCVTAHEFTYTVSQEERTKFREGVPYVKLYRYNPKHIYPKLNGYGDNGKRSLKL